MITKTIPISTKIVICYTVKQGILFIVRQKINRNIDNSMIRISQWRESHCRTTTNVRRKKEFQKSNPVRVIVRDPSRKLTIRVRSSVPPE